MSVGPVRTSPSAGSDAAHQQNHPAEDTAKSGPRPGIEPLHRVLIITASMGAGHDGAARELAARLQRRGHRPETKDFLSAFPIGLGWFFRWLYGRMLALAPWTYDAIYKIFPFMYSPFSFAEHHITQRSLRKWLRQYKPDVIVSTYPLASLALGRMRLGGKLHTPVITYITDFHAYPLVTHEGVDLHLAVHDVTRDGAMRRITGPVHTCAPLVSSRFAGAAPSTKRNEPRGCADRRHPTQELGTCDRSEQDLSQNRRNRYRQGLSISDDEIMVLVVAGSWGAGEVEETVLDIANCDGVVPVVICGKNEELLARISQLSTARAVGWTKDMPELMAAADVLIDNAGGLTAMEALAAGLPIINYRPLAGHGRDNALDMQRAGVVSIAHDRAELVNLIAELGHVTERRNAQVQAGFAMFEVDAADDVLAYASGQHAPIAHVIPIAKETRRRRRRRRLISAAAASVLTISLGLTTGVGEATAHGIGTDKGDYDNGTYVGVRMTSDELNDQQTEALIKSMPVTMIVDGPTAKANESQIRSLVSSGVDIASGGSGEHDPGWAPWSRARLDLEAGTEQVSQSSGVNATTFVPSRRLDGFDLYFSHRLHMHALPTAKLVKVGQEQDSLTDHGIFIVDGRGETVGAFRDRLMLMQSLVQHGNLSVQPFSAVSQ
jgi:processive 1,2-diacylglycerol beta-glucosyltransferase